MRHVLRFSAALSALIGVIALMILFPVIVLKAIAVAIVFILTAAGLYGLLSALWELTR